MRAVLTAFAVSAACLAAAGATPEWEDPAVTSRNRLPPRTYTAPLADESAAVGWDLEPESPYVKSLNGRWKIFWCGAPAQRPADFWQPGFDDSEWGTVDVPSCVELRGYGTPGYTNVRYPFALRFPRILDRQTEKADYNPVSSYRTAFTVPESWKGRRVILRFDGVYSAYYVWVNGRKVGYAEDSKLPSEFDVTPYLNPVAPIQQSNNQTIKQSDNVLAVEVYRWCDGSYLEDQDMFRFSGIFRDVSLIALPKDGIWDFAVKTTPVDGYGRWNLEVEVERGNGGVVERWNGGEVERWSGGEVERGSGGKVERWSGGEVEWWRGGMVERGNGGKVEKGSGGEVEKGNGGEVEKGNGGEVEKGNGGEVERWNGGMVGALYDSDGKKIGELRPHSNQTSKQSSNQTISTTLAARAWSAEDPYLYTLVVKTGSDIRARKIGFKDVRVGDDGVLRVNGRVVKFRGVNRHEHSMANGRTVSLKEMTDDVVLMKRANVNTVRTSHYPDHRLWYALCDKYGIYLCAEANVEAHEEDYKGNWVGRKVEFDGMIVERNRRHVEFYRNHPSVTIWSLGNECGSGQCFVHAEAAVKAADPMKRPTHWERGNENCDVDSKMYCKVEWLYERAKWAKEPGAEYGMAEWTGSWQCKRHPVFVSEYSHAMGNALGNFEEYWQAFYSSDVLSGGCVWDWVDQALVKTDDRLGPDGRRIRYWAYGGDWDEEPHDGPFCCNGVIRPDRKWSAKLVELAHVFRPFRLRLADGGVEIWNTTAFTPGDAYRARWELLSDGRVVDGGEWSLPSVGPWSRRVVPLPKMKPAAGECFFNAYWELRDDTAWAKKGWCVARDQVMVKKGNGGEVERWNGGEVERWRGGMVERWSGGEVERWSGGKVEVAESDDGIRVADARLEAVFSRRTGTLSSLKMDGRTVLADTDGLVAGPRLGMNRAWTDNDGFMERGNGDATRYNTFGLNQLAFHPGKFKVARGPDGAVTVSVLTRVNGRKSGGYEHAAAYVFTGNGRLRIGNRAKPFGTMPPFLPRFGLGLKLDGRLENVRWYGRGPSENYCDRKTGSLVGVWHSTVTDLYEDYVRPQDNGYRSDVRWVEFSDGDGKGVRFAFGEPGYFQALHYDCEDLLFARHRRGEHRCQNLKPPRREVCLNLDLRQTGLGGGSCGPSTRPEYCYAPKSEEWSVELSPREPEHNAKGER